VFVAGRIAVEPLRTVPQYDAKGMDPYSAVEQFQLRRNSEPFRVAVFGSSVSIWGVLTELVADELKLPPHDVRKLAVVGGTPFDHWKLIERSPAEFDSVRTALIELNPRMMHPDLEGDERVRYTISQHATWDERQKLWHRHERNLQRLDVALPLNSVRRSLRSVFLDVVQPEHGNFMCPKPDARLLPFFGWHVPEGTSPYFRDLITPQTAARRLLGNWHPSTLQDACLHKTLEFLRARGVRIIFYQLPVHPAVAAEIRANPKYASAYQKFLAYVDTLGVPILDRLQLVDIAECGAPTEAMRDLTHFNEIGARIYSRWLGSRVRSLLGSGPRPGPGSG
jgi:hypothetical protein